jgi:5-methylcytosine-specific restriction protein A
MLGSSCAKEHMPNSPLRPCANPGRPTLATSGRCELHRKAKEKTRGTTKQRGYAGDWQRRRLAILQRDHGLYQQCLREGLTKSADEVDHIVPLNRGGNYTDANLESLCHRCHSTKTYGESLGRGPSMLVIPPVSRGVERG